MSVKRYGPEVCATTLPIARAVEANGWPFVSGQVPMADGVLVTGSMIVQGVVARIRIKIG
jgi:enamine deaminase RidA (YjgF/YER057c/UK114 family)